MIIIPTQYYIPTSSKLFEYDAPSTIPIDSTGVVSNIRAASRAGYHYFGIKQALPRSKIYFEITNLVNTSTNFYAYPHTLLVQSPFTVNGGLNGVGNMWGTTNFIVLGYSSGRIYRSQLGNRNGILVVDANWTSYGTKNTMGLFDSQTSNGFIGFGEGITVGYAIDLTNGPAAMTVTVIAQMRYGDGTIGYSSQPFAKTNPIALTGYIPDGDVYLQCNIGIADSVRFNIGQTPFALTVPTGYVALNQS